MSAQSLPLGIPWGIGKRFGSAPKPLLIGLSLFVVLALVAGTIVFTRSHAAPAVATTPVLRQSLSQSVTASGTVNPQNSISVGTQVSGTISELYVDYNSKVKKGQVLARIDPSTIAAQLSQAQANLAQAQAQANEASANANGAGSGVTVAQANANAQQAAAAASKTNIAKAQSALVLAQSQAQRDQSLLSQGFMAQATVQADNANVAQDQSALASAQAAYAQSQAQATASDATVGQSGSTAQAQQAQAQAAQAAVAAAQATVQQDDINLKNTVITSPVDGTVVSRAVSVGQTVAASLQTPTLFTIAQNLGQMEVDINVAEPDIGGVKKGDGVDFSVLAYPNQVFHGAVQQVRINPQTVNNVVTYDVVVDVNNNDGKLLPGMTANATIAVATVNDALVVPLTALHQQQSGGVQAASAATNAQAQGSAASPWGGTTGVSSGAITSGSNARLLVQRDGKIARVNVHVDLVTTTQAAVTPTNGSTLSQGDNVVTSFTSANGTHANRNGSAQNGANPMMGGGASRGATRGLP